MLAFPLGPLNPVTMETPEGARSDSHLLGKPLKWKPHQAQSGTLQSSRKEPLTLKPGVWELSKGCREDPSFLQAPMTKGCWLPGAKVRKVFCLD